MNPAFRLRETRGSPEPPVNAGRFTLEERVVALSGHHQLRLGHSDPSDGARSIIWVWAVTCVARVRR